MAAISAISAAVTGNDKQPLVSNGPRASDLYDDIADMVLLMAVFSVGWVLFNKLALRVGQGPRRQKTAPWSPPSSASAKLVPGLTPCQAQFAKEQEWEEQSDVIGKGETALDAAAPVVVSMTLDGRVPMATPPRKVPDALKDICFDESSWASDCQVTGSPDTTVPPLSDWCGDLGDFSPLDEFSFEVVDGFGTLSSSTPLDALAADSATHREIFELEDVDARLREAATRGDMSVCRQLWQSAAASCGATTLSSSTCAALESAIRRATVVAADADLALEAAVTSGHAGLGEAALMAGARARDSAWHANASKRLFAAGVPLSAERLVALARAHGREGRADLAADLWQKQCAAQGVCLSGGDAGHAAGLLPLPELYSAALEACATAGDFQSAARVAKSAGWVAPRSAAGQAALLALARWLAKHQGSSSARRCVTAIGRAGGKPDSATLKTVLAASARAGDMVQADELFRELASTTAPDYATYSLMVRGFCAAGNIEEALQHFRAIRQHGLRPDAALFDSVLGACASRNLLSIAEEVLADMEASGVRPTSSTLAVLTRLHGARGALGRATEIFEELPRRHAFEPDARAYHALISACLDSGRLDLALSAFSRMSAAGCHATARTYEVLVTAALRNGDLDGAADLVEDALGLQPLQPPVGAADPAADAATTMGHEQDGTETDLETPPSSPPPAPRLPLRQPQHLPQRRALLEQRVIEELLELAGRRREAARLGLPLLVKLQEAGVQVSERIAAALRRAAAAEQATRAAPPSEQQGEEAEEQEEKGDKVAGARASRESRRAVLRCWRDGFRRLPADAASLEKLSANAHSHNAVLSGNCSRSASAATVARGEACGGAQNGLEL